MILARRALKFTIPQQSYQNHAARLAALGLTPLKHPPVPACQYCSQLMHREDLHHFLCFHTQCPNCEEYHDKLSHRPPLRGLNKLFWFAETARMLDLW